MPLRTGFDSEKYLAEQTTAITLLMDYWPLGRLKIERSAGIDYQRRLISRLILEKVPLFLLAAGLSFFTLLLRSKGGL